MFAIFFLQNPTLDSKYPKFQGYGNSTGNKTSLPVKQNWLEPTQILYRNILLDFIVSGRVINYNCQILRIRFFYALVDMETV